jgi:enoyl-CoA hydratase/carnithine racemase
MTVPLETIATRVDGGVLYATIDAPPINLIGPEVVRDLVTLLGTLRNLSDVRVVVFDSADKDFMFPHVDVTKVAQYTAEAAKAGGPGDESLGMLFRKLSQAPVVTIAKLRGRARAAGSEFVLACDMRFASRERTILSQPEVGLGLAPGAGGLQHLTRLLGRGRALEVILSAEDVDADMAERYGWINRALPDAELDGFVERLARRIAGFPAEAVMAAKAAVNGLTLAAPDEVRSDARLFQRLVRTDAAQQRTAQLFARGFQTRSAVELDLGEVLGELTAEGHGAG